MKQLEIIYTKEWCGKQPGEKEKIWDLEAKELIDLGVADIIEPIQNEIETNQMLKELENNEPLKLSEFKKLFENTHDHLSLWPIIETEMPLQGGDYYTIKKALTYFGTSILQTAHQFTIGREKFDNRIHILTFIGAGKGKGIIKNAIRKIRGNDSVAEISGNSNVEQFLGKVLETKKGQVEREGFLRKRVIIHDEAANVINEADHFTCEVMAIERKAMDVLGQNYVDKKLVDMKSVLSFTPETQFLTLCHKTTLEPRFFDLGTFRRFFAFESNDSPTRDLNDATRNLLMEYQESEVQGFLNDERARMKEKIITGFTREAIERMIFWIDSWNWFCLTNSNQNVRLIGQKWFYSNKIYFGRMIAVLAISKGQTTPTIDIVDLACRDTIQFLIETLSYYEKNGLISLSKDAWKSDDTTEAMFLEWLAYNNATTQEKSPVSIRAARVQVEDYFGVNERQARSILNRMKKRGYIRMKQLGYGDTKCWLAFEPPPESILNCPPPINPVFSNNLLEELANLLKKNNKEARVA